MGKWFIILIGDQHEVLQTITKHFEYVKDAFAVNDCNSVLEALDIMTAVDNHSDPIALIISHRGMPNKISLDF